MKQILVTVRNISIFSSGLRMHLHFFIQQMQKLGYKVVCLGQRQDMIDSAKRDFSSLSPIGFVLYESLKEYLKQNYHNIAFLLAWEVYVGDDMGKMFHDHSIPVVQFGCGNQYIPKLYSFKDNQENSIFSKYSQYYSLFCSLPHHISSHQIKQIIYQKPSIVVPYIWNSTHIRCPEINHDYTCDAFQHIYVMEPNYDSLKNCFVPLVAIIHLMNTQPHLLQDAKIHFLCSDKVKDSIVHLIRSSCKHPEELMKRTDIQKRFNIRDLIIRRQKKSPAIVISHQNKNELNNLYFDCLYAGIPLIHNSTMIGNCGYRYKDHDVKQIATHLSHLIQGGVTYHKDMLKSQKTNVDTLMHTLDPFNPDVMSYMKRWCHVIETRNFKAISSWSNIGNKFETQILEYKPVFHTLTAHPCNTIQHKEVYQIECQNGTKYRELGKLVFQISPPTYQSIHLDPSCEIYWIHPFAGYVNRNTYKNLWMGNHIFQNLWNLQDCGYKVGYNDTFIKGKINIIPYNYILCLRNKKDEAESFWTMVQDNPDTTFVCITAEYTNDPLPQYENVRYIRQNPSFLQKNDFYFPLFDRTIWNDSKKKRNRESNFTVGYFGCSSNCIEYDFESVCKKHGITFISSTKPEDWNTMCYSCDAIVAIRPDIQNPYHSKPASKLINAIRLGVPFICGKESAYVYEWERCLEKTPAVRFVTSEEEIETEILFVKQQIDTLRSHIQSIQSVYSNRSFAKRFFHASTKTENVHSLQSWTKLHFEVIHCVESDERLPGLLQNLNDVKQYLTQTIGVEMTWNIMSKTRHPSNGAIGCSTNHIKAFKTIASIWQPNTLFGILEDDNLFELDTLQQFVATLKWMWQNRQNNQWTLWNSNPSLVNQQKFDYQCNLIQGSSVPSVLSTQDSHSIVRMDGQANNCLIFRPDPTMFTNFIQTIESQFQKELQSDHPRHPYLFTDVIIRLYYGDTMITTVPYLCYQKPSFSIIENRKTNYRQRLKWWEMWIIDNIAQTQTQTYDYLEIGTSNFETLNETFCDLKGISVEPVKSYYESLTSNDKKVTLNYAVSNTTTNSCVDVYYIPEEVVDQNKLPMWFKGCNSIHSYHPLHIKHNVQDLVNIDKVKCVSVQSLFQTYSLDNLLYVKIDTEGHDLHIMDGIASHISNKSAETYPNIIQFESNQHVQQHDVKQMIHRYQQMGYEVVLNKDDTILQTKYVTRNDTKQPNLWCYWTGTNPMSEHRKSCLKSLQATKFKVTLVTPDSLSSIVHPSHPIHEAYQYLSETHKADYLRCYCMHIYGGGYSDIKKTSAHWIHCNTVLQKNSNLWGIGYKEIGPHGVPTNPDDPSTSKLCKDRWWHLIGNGAYIMKPNTPFTKDWFETLHALLDSKLSQLKQFPSKHPQQVYSKSYPYPFRWAQILGEIFHPLILQYKDHFLQILPPPSFKEYR